MVDLETIKPWNKWLNPKKTLIKRKGWKRMRKDFKWANVKLKKILGQCKNKENILGQCENKRKMRG